MKINAVSVASRFVIVLLASTAMWGAQSTAPLRLEKTIPLPDVQGRIDHMSLDVRNDRLFVAALGNNTDEVIDVKQGKRIHSIPGFREPQGVLYLTDVNRLYVANGDDGTLRIFDGSSYEPIKTIKLGDDADNIRFDAEKKHVYVGYGSGALAVVNEDGTKLFEIVLDAHPESFSLRRMGRGFSSTCRNHKKWRWLIEQHGRLLPTGARVEHFRITRWPSMRKIIACSLSAVCLPDSLSRIQTPER